MNHKIFTLSSQIKSVSKNKDTITITGMASTSEIDRVGDIIVPEAWSKGGLDNFTKNPIILFNHNYNNPVGKGTEFKVTDKGLEITAEISKADPRVAILVEQGILKTFSVGFLSFLSQPIKGLFSK
jgi:phage head maturation protease